MTVPAARINAHASSGTIPIYFGVTKIPPSQLVDPGLVSGRNLYISNNAKITKNKQSSYTLIYEEGPEYWTGLKYIVNCSSWSSQQEIPLYYRFTGLNLVGSSNRRCIPLGQLSISINDPYGLLANMISGSAELRIGDHINDFSLERNGLPYHRFPLAVAPPASSGDLTTFHFAPTTNLYYGRKDLSMYGSPPNEDYFVSKDIFIPLRKKHDFDSYFYQIVLTDFGPFHSEKFVIPGFISFSSRLFGSGKEGEFYVAVGEE